MHLVIDHARHEPAARAVDDGLAGHGGDIGADLIDTARAHPQIGLEGVVIVDERGVLDQKVGHGTRAV